MPQEKDWIYTWFGSSEEVKVLDIGQIPPLSGVKTWQGGKEYIIIPFEKNEGQTEE